MTKKQRSIGTKTYTNKGSGRGLRWQWSFVYEATGRRGRDLSWQWSLFPDENRWLIMTKKQRGSETKTYTNKGNGRGLGW